LLVPKLPLGNGFLKLQLPEEPSTNKLELARHGFPSWSLGTSATWFVILITKIGI